MIITYEQLERLSNSKEVVDIVNQLKLDINSTPEIGDFIEQAIEMIVKSAARQGISRFNYKSIAASFLALGIAVGKEQITIN